MNENWINISPVPFKGGSEAEYVVELLKNSGLGTRHIPSNSVVPHVLGEQIPIPGESIEIMEHATSFMEIGAQALQGGMQAANLGVGLLNLGVSAWTAWKVHAMDKKLDSLGQVAGQIDGKVDAMAGMLEYSVIHLDGLIRNNSLMLGFIIQHQHRLDESISALRLELARGVASVHGAISDSDARREAMELEQQMRSLFRSYQLCSGELQEGRMPPTNDLRKLIETASDLITWLDTRLSTFEKGRAERLPLFIARVTALRMEMDARGLLDDAPSFKTSEYLKMQRLLKDEVHVLLDGASLMQLACERAHIIEQYIFLHRSTRGSATMLELRDGSTRALMPASMCEWDDGLERFRELIECESPDQRVERLELDTLQEHKAWRQLRRLPRGASDDEVDPEELLVALGVDPSKTFSETQLRGLLKEGAAHKEEVANKIMKEVGE